MNSVLDASLATAYLPLTQASQDFAELATACQAKLGAQGLPARNQGGRHLVSMELLEILKILGRYRAMITVLCLSALVSSIALTYVVTERYESSALVLVRPQEVIKVSTGGSEKENLNFPIPRIVPFEAMSKTFGEVIRSRTVAAEVVRRLNLDKPTVESSWLKRWKKRIKSYIHDVWTYMKYGRVKPADPFVQATEMIQNHISVEPTKDTYVFEIRYLGELPELASAVVNTAADVFVEYNLELYRSENAEARKSIEDQLHASQSALTQARNELRVFKERYDIIDLSREVETSVDTLAKLKSDSDRLRRDVAAVQAKVSELRRQLDMGPDKGGASNRRVLSGAVREKLLPELILAESELKSLQAGEARQLGLIDAYDKNLRSLPEQQVELAKLELALSVAENTYRFIRKAHDEALIKEAAQVDDIRVVAPGTTPAYPARPIKVYYAATALALALFVSVVIVLLLEYLNFTLETSEAAEAALKAPLLATIPRIGS